MRFFTRSLLGAALVICSTPLARAENMSVGVGPTGEFFVIDGHPDLSTGFGGHIYFDYRWAPQISTQFSVDVTTQDGRNAESGDNNILLFGIPTIDFKYYMIKSTGRIDPYVGLGVGFFLVSEGSNGTNGTMAMGLGADVTVGADFYFTPQLSGNVRTTFHSIGLVNSPSGNNNGTGLFPLTTAASVAFHF